MEGLKFIKKRESVLGQDKLEAIADFVIEFEGVSFVEKTDTLFKERKWQELRYSLDNLLNKIMQIDRFSWTRLNVVGVDYTASIFPLAVNKDLQGIKRIRKDMKEGVENDKRIYISSDDSRALDPEDFHPVDGVEFINEDIASTVYLFLSMVKKVATLDKDLSIDKHMSSSNESLEFLYNIRALASIDIFRYLSDINLEQRRVMPTYGN